MRTAARVLLCGLLLAALVSVSGCATTLEASTRPRSSADLQAQVFKLQKDTARILALLEQDDDRSSVDAQAACAEVAARLVEIERRMGAIEEQLLATQSRIDDAVTEVRTLRRTLPYTFGRAEQATGPGRPPVPAGSPAPAETGQPATGAPAEGAAPETGAGEAAPPALASPEDRFNAAYADFSRGNYDLALTEFEQALRADPNGPLAATCQYFIGETLMAMSRYADAVAAFDQLISAYPDSQRVIIARLKRGIALFESRRTVEAVQALQDLINEAPDSDEARIAEEYLRRKGIEAN